MFRERPLNNPKFGAYARDLRRRSTPHEQRLWQLLRGRRFDGHKFRRQVSIGRYIADFACFDARLIIELDGSQHFESAYDAERDSELIRRGFQVMRVWDSELTTNEAGVLDAILAVLEPRAGQGTATPHPASPPSPTGGEGHIGETTVGEESP